MFTNQTASQNSRATGPLSGRGHAPVVATRQGGHSYLVVMIDYGRKGREANVDPEVTRREAISRIQSREYDPDRIIFIHEICNGEVVDVTDELIEQAECQRLIAQYRKENSADRQALACDHARDLRKHES